MHQYFYVCYFRSFQRYLVPPLPSLPLPVENIYISKTFWLSGSIQLDVVREHPANKLAVREINLLESNLTLLYLFGFQDP